MDFPFDNPIDDEATGDFDAPELSASGWNSFRHSNLSQLIHSLVFVVALTAGMCWLLTGQAHLGLSVLVATGALFLMMSLAVKKYSTLTSAFSIFLFGLSIYWKSQSEVAMPTWLDHGPFSLEVLFGASFASLFLCCVDNGWLTNLTRAVRKQIAERPAFCFLVAASLFIVGFTLVPVVIENWRKPEPPTTGIQPLEEPSILEMFLLQLSQAVTTVGVFSVGASIGSFVNVLVYRIPQRRSVFTNRSACPQCRQPIHGYDNIPILGWLQLKGRCRSCEMRISPEYPIVEFIGGVLLVVLFFWQTLSGGWNIPERITNFYNGFVWIIFYTKWDLIGLLLLHGFLAYTLFTWWLIQRSGSKIPAYSFWWAIGIVGTAAAIWPNLIPVPSGLAWNGTDRLEGLLAVSIGAVSGSFIGFAFAQAARILAIFSNLQSYYFLGVIGAILGWQAAITIGLLWVIVGGLAQVVANLGPKIALPRNTLLLFVVTIHHLFWRQIYDALPFESL